MDSLKKWNCRFLEAGEWLRPSTLWQTIPVTLCALLFLFFVQLFRFPWFASFYNIPFRELIINWSLLYTAIFLSLICTQAIKINPKDLYSFFSVAISSFGTSDFFIPTLPNSLLRSYMTFLALNGRETVYRSFSINNTKWASIIYQFVDAVLIGNLFRLFLPILKQLFCVTP